MPDEGYYPKIVPKVKNLLLSIRASGPWYDENPLMARTSNF